MSAAFLSEDWLELLAERGAALPEVAGATVTVQHEIAGAPDGKVRFHCVWEDGRLTTVQLGKHAEPDVMVVAKAPDALAVLAGDVAPEVSWMQGRLKIDGDYRRLLIDLRDWRTGDAYRALWQAMADDTES